MRLLFLAATSFVVTYIVVIEPIELYLDRARDFVVAVEKKRAHAHAALVFYREKPDSMPIKYMINTPLEVQPVFIENQNALVTYVRPAYFVTSQSYYAELPQHLAQLFDVIANDSLGHVRVVVFKRKGVANE